MVTYGKLPFVVGNSFPKFYENVVIGFNKVKCIKPFHLLSTSEIVQLPLWGSEYFKVCNTCLYLKPFIDKEIYYVKDIVDNKGNILADRDIIRIASGESNQIQQSYIFKNCVINKIRSKDLSISQYVKIKDLTMFLYKNKNIEINCCTSKLFYEILISKIMSRGNMESVFSKTFNFECREVWKHICTQ